MEKKNHDKRKWTELLMGELQGVKFIWFCIKGGKKKFLQQDGFANEAKKMMTYSHFRKIHVINQGDKK